MLYHQTVLHKASSAFSLTPAAAGGCVSLYWGHVHLTHHLQNGEFSPDVAAKTNQYIQWALSRV